MNGIATCPFCNVINRFGENERRCPHYKGFEHEKTDDCVYEDRPLAIFCEDEKKVLIERKIMNKVIGHHYKTICPFCKRVTKIKEMEDGLSVQSCCEHYSHLVPKTRPIKVYFKGAHLVDTEEDGYGE